MSQDIGQLRSSELCPSPEVAQADVVISSGNRNFHMLFTAAELAQRNRLAMLICGGYPRPWERALLKGPLLRGSRKFDRFLGRQENIPDDLISQSRGSETISAAGMTLRGIPLARKIDTALQEAAFRAYGRHAARQLPKAAAKGARIYHYRAGFGQSSVPVARQAGMRTICDHSIVHPSLLQVLVQNGGRFPESQPGRPGGIWGSVLDDIAQADMVLVNSQFVAETFVFMGFDRSRLAVVYQGVENKFLARLPQTRDYYEAGSPRPVRLLFAGGIGPRKGVDEIARALAALPDAALELHMAGSLSSEARERYAGLLADPRVTYHGMLSQNDLAMLMSRSDVFLFPSRAEGSARVVFEAMAAGCAVITTPNAGSAVRASEGGLLVPPSDHDALVAALEALLADPAAFARMGQCNRDLIRDSYTQASYGDALERVYQ